MKKPEYTLKKDLKTWPNGLAQDPIEYPAGTLIQPFWNEGYVPEHIREKLQRDKKIDNSMINFRWDVPKEEPVKTIVCLIGRDWVEVPENDIRENR